MIDFRAQAIVIEEATFYYQNLSGPITSNYLSFISQLNPLRYLLNCLLSNSGKIFLPSVLTSPSQAKKNKESITTKISATKEKQQ